MSKECYECKKNMDMNSLYIYYECETCFEKFCEDCTDTMSVCSYGHDVCDNCIIYCVYCNKDICDNCSSEDCLICGTSCCPTCRGTEDECKDCENL